MKIVGVGCGPGMLTEEAIRVIASATSVYGSDRAIELARAHIPESCDVRSIDDFKNLSHLPEDAVILSTGDPMLAGLGYLNGEVIPGISSLQVAAARLRIPLARVTVVVAHGKGHEKGMQETLLEVKHGKIVFLLADPKFNVTELYQRLSAAEIPVPLRIAVCENLGYPDERIITGDLQALPMPNADLYSLVIGHF
jgi:cobalt-precorrin-7 (C5)-methyltransferase